MSPNPTCVPANPARILEGFAIIFAGFLCEIVRICGGLARLGEQFGDHVERVIAIFDNMLGKIRRNHGGSTSGAPVQQRT